MHILNNFGNTQILKYTLAMSSSLTLALTFSASVQVKCIISDKCFASLLTVFRRGTSKETFRSLASM